MDGVAVVRSLLVANTATTALVPLARIRAGVLPVGIALDAISITRVSAKDRNIPAPGANRRVDERVQVTALAKSYPAAKAIIRAVKTAAADFIGSAAGLVNVTIHTDYAGPDFMDEEASIYASTQDFIVGFTEQR